MKKIYKVSLFVCLVLSGCIYGKNSFDSKYYHEVAAKELAKLQFETGTFESSFLNQATNVALLTVRPRLEALVHRELTHSENDKLNKIIREVMTETYHEDLFEGPLVNLYQKYYTAEEILELIKFYKTPTGTKFLKLGEKMMQEMEEIGKSIGISKEKEFVEKFKKKFTKAFLKSKESDAYKNTDMHLSLVWSDNPGAFEQHLIRRYNNPLFPKERRIITQKDIEMARAQDIRNYEKLNKQLIKLVQDISEISSKVDYNTLNEFRERIDDIVLEALGVGGKANLIVVRCKQLRNALINDLNEWFSIYPNAKAKLQEAEIFYHENLKNYEIPFIAQMYNKKKPIPAKDIVPSLLMEEPSTIAMTLSLLKPDERFAVQQSAIKILRSAINEGALIKNSNQIFMALGVK